MLTGWQQTLNGVTDSNPTNNKHEGEDEIKYILQTAETTTQLRQGEPALLISKSSGAYPVSISISTPHLAAAQGHKRLS
jgi:hypothetical protein